MPALDSCAVHQDRDLVPVFENCGCQGCYFGLRGEVCGVDCGLAAQGFDCGFRCEIGMVALAGEREMVS
jgi:hypothetical protein